MGGQPTGTGGKGVLLLSGGIDSPVAGWYAIRKGMSLSTLFGMFPGDEKGLEKYKLLAGKLEEYHSGIPIRKYYVELPEVCGGKETIVVYRRLLFRVADRISRGGFIVTGESLGQVSSQTPENMIALSKDLESEVVRPLFGFDKLEIINKAMEIGTYRISTMPSSGCEAAAARTGAVTNLGNIKELEKRHKIEELLDEIEIKELK